MPGPQLKLPASLGNDLAAAGTGRSTRPVAEMVPLHVAVILYAILIGFNQRLLNDPDTYSHIAAGRWIWEHGRVPSADPFSFTLAGAPWIPHEWLSELIFAGLYGVLGWTGVVAITATAAAFAFALLAKLYDEHFPVPAAWIVVLPSFLLVFPHVLARPHVLAMPILVAWAISLDRACSNAARPPYRLLPLMTLWANLHGSFVIGLALAAAYGAEAVITAAGRTERWPAARAWGGFLGAAALLSLITPNGISGPLFAFHLANQSYILSLVIEWQSANFSSLGGIEIWVLGLLALGFVAPLRLPLIRLAMLLGLVHITLAHIRNADLLALLTPIILVYPLKQAFAAPLHRDLGKLPASYYGAAVFALCVATGAVAWRGITHDDQRIAPTEAIAAATAAGVTGPVLNAYGFGGYLMFAGIAPFVDGRGDLYLDAFMRDYMSIVTAKGDALPKALERYHIGWTLLTPDVNAVGVLDRLPGWQRVYADDNAVVHRRIEPTP